MVVGEEVQLMPETLNQQIELCRAFGERVFCYHRTELRRFVWSYAQLFDHADRMAAALRRRGVQRGERIMIWGPNGPEWIIAYLGGLLAGAVIVPIDVRQTKDFALRVAAETKPRLIARTRLLPGDGFDLPQLILEELPLRLSEVEPQRFDDVAPQPDDLALIMYTSGTTAVPKGVMVTHRNITANYTAVQKAIPLQGHHTFLSLLPLSHLYEQTGGFWYPVARGDSIVYLQTVTPKAIEQAFRHEHIRAVLAVPRLLQLLKDGFVRKLPISESRLERLLRWTEPLPRSVKKLIYFPLHHFIGWDFAYFVLGGAPLDPALQLFWERLGFIVLQGYGLTETGPVITVNRPEARRLGSVGQALPGLEMKLSPEGEVLTRGPHVTPGYFQRPDATRESFTEDGWFRTGDLGRLDEDGFLFLQGRLKELIVTDAGVNVYPLDIESVLDRFDGVRESCVVEFKKRIHAVLLMDEHAKPRAAEIISQANRQLDEAQRVQAFTVWWEDDFPRTTTLKVKKGEVLAKLHAREAAADIAVPAATAVVDDIAALVARIADVPVTQITPQSKLGDDLGLSSIDRVELVSLIEWEKRIDLGDVDLTPEMTVAELRQLIERNQPDRASLKFPRWGRWPIIRWLRELLQLAALFPIFRLFVRLTIKGRDVLPAPDSGPYVFIANHTSHADTAAILYALPGRFRRRLTVAAWAEFFLRPGQPLLSWLFRWVLYPFLVVLAHIYMIPQQRSPRLSLQYTGELLDHGYHVLIYPEGERHASNQMAPFMDGLGLMVMDMRVSVIPIKLDGLDRTLPRGSAFPRFASATLTFGQPIPPQAGTHAEIAARLREAVKSL
ncbi:MAG: AMP-binding protein [Acidobacteriota bacterium]|nr:AMP-binding protein [Acidobacteriota bacterium]